MQTFLPYKSFEASAKSLDMKRLGKQRVETLQLLNSITGKTQGRGWTNHPCRAMWSKHVPALVEYGLIICREWLSRGYKDTCYDKIAAFGVVKSPEMPWWLGNDIFHTSHQANLVRKKPEFYRQLWPTVDSSIPYQWPTDSKKFITI